MIQHFRALETGPLSLLTECPGIRAHFRLAPPPHVYHYTDFTGLLGIIKSKEFWLSDIHHLNDRAELHDALQVLRSVIHERLRHPDDTTALLQSVLQRAETSSEWGYFIGSFSEHPNLLSQWRGYCPDGGVSIGFVAERLKQMIASQGLYLAKCIYDPVVKHELIQQLVARTTSYFHQPQGIEWCGEFFMNYYWLICQIFKHWSFVEEREWRLISVSGFDRQFCDVRVTNNTLLRYYKLQLLAADKIDEKNDLGFDEIFIGPQDQAERSLMNIRYLVDLQNIYPPALHYSESSYRKNK